MNNTNTTTRLNVTKSTILRNAHTYARELRQLDPSLHYSLALSAGMKQAWSESRSNPSDSITHTFPEFYMFPDGPMPMLMPEKTVTTQRRFVEWFDMESHQRDQMWFILGLDADTASSRDIRRSYRRLAHTAHPDHGGCNVAMDQLTWAKDSALHSIYLRDMTDEENEMYWTE